MQYIEAFSQEHKNQMDEGDNPCSSIFLAGGISNCPNWQSEVVASLADFNITVVNPRRVTFDIFNHGEAAKQIEWEHKHLSLCDNILFWFPRETVCPITLLEYGKFLPMASGKNLFVGCHRQYSRNLDLDVQTRLERPDMRIYRDIDSVLHDVYAHFWNR
jgi:hypothetical protein